MEHLTEESWTESCRSQCLQDLGLLEVFFYRFCAGEATSLMEISVREFISAVMFLLGPQRSAAINLKFPESEQTRGFQSEELRRR